jgi:RsiW-degrading membrane proteinase PrsW (M82 family)
MKVLWVIIALSIALCGLSCCCFIYIRRGQAKGVSLIVISFVLGSLMGALVCFLSGENVWHSLP